jgi:internalin A
MLPMTTTRLHFVHPRYSHSDSKQTDGITEVVFFSSTLAERILRSASGCSEVALVGFDLSSTEVASLFSSDAFEGLTTLNLSGNQIGNEGAQSIAKNLTNLTTLDLSSNQIGDQGAQSIAENLPNLTTLNLWGNQIGDQGAESVAENLTHLTTLQLGSNHIGVEGAQSIAKNLPNLTTLDLSSNQIGDQGAQSVAENLPNLTTLDLSSNQIGNEGAQSIAENLPNLTTLNLWNSQIGVEGAQSIAENLANLTTLDLSSNQIGDEGAQSIAENLTHLTNLTLWGNEIGDPGAQSIAENLTNLTTLELWGNQIGDEGAQSIAENLPNLTTLELWGNRIGIEGAQSIAENLANLTTLDLGSNQIGDEGAQSIAKNLTNLTSLNLGGNHIGVEGARSLAKNLTNLTTLKLWDCQIGDEGARSLAENLTNLTNLILGNCQIGAQGAQSIAKNLTNLTTLNLWDSQIGDEGARSIAKNLTNLTTLDLGNSQISDQGAQSIAKNLTNLTTLELWGNQIGDEGAQSIAKNLTNLTTLELWGNQIGDEGARSIAENLTNLTTLKLGGERWQAQAGTNNRIGKSAAELVERLPKLRVLSLRDCGLDTSAVLAVLDALRYKNSRLKELDIGGNDTGDLPAELLQTSVAEQLLAAFVEYERATSEDDLVALNEAKLVLLGEEAVGKTSLVRFLVKNQPRLATEPKTIGANRHERIETGPWIPGGTAGPVVNIWDFGGQEMQRHTHRYFLTRRCLYLIVLNARKEDDRSVVDWLKIIRSRGGDSPVIIVINGCDNASHRLTLDFAKLQTEHPEIVRVVTTSCNDDALSRTSIQELRELIIHTMETDDRLQTIRDRVPSSWLRVKQEITEVAKTKHVLTTGEFAEICTRGDSKRERIEGDALQHAVLGMLDLLGVIVAHGLRGGSSASSRELTLLEPNWLTQAIYGIVEQAGHADRLGEFDGQDLVKFLDPAQYPLARHEYLIDLMQDPELGLCLTLPGSKPPRYLVPEALPSGSPDISAWRDAEALRFRFRYDLLPSGLIPQLIVEAHDMLTTNRTVWRSGAIFLADGCKVLVDGDLANRQIDIVIMGPAVRRRRALAILLRCFDTVHARNTEATATRRVPFPDKIHQDVSYEYLELLEASYGDDHRQLFEGGSSEYRVGDLLDGVRHERPIPGRSGPNRLIASALVEPPITSSLVVQAAATLQRSNDSPDEAPLATSKNNRSWNSTAALTGLAAALSTLIVWFVPWPRVQAGIAIAAAAGGLIFLFLLFRNPASFYRRMIGVVVLGGTAASAVGFTLHAVVDTKDGNAALSWVGDASPWFWIAWVVVIALLILGDYLHRDKAT